MMWKYVFSVPFLVLLAMAYKWNVPPRVRIMGGDSVEIKDYPYQVMLMRKGIPYCGGSLIQLNYVLTAAHCVYDGYPGDFSVRAGSSIINEGGIVSDVIGIKVHNGFNAATYENDVAVLKLGLTFPSMKNIKTVNLPDKDESLPVGSLGTVTGWGKLSPSGPTPDRLQKVDLPIQSVDYCKAKWNDLSAGMFCAGVPQGGKDTCQDLGKYLIYISNGKDPSIAGEEIVTCLPEFLFGEPIWKCLKSHDITITVNSSVKT